MGEDSDTFEATGPCARESDLCSNCALQSWDDISKLSECGKIKWKSPFVLTATCPMCRLLETLIDHVNVDVHLAPRTGLETMGAELTQSDLRLCCLLGSPNASSVFTSPTLLVSRLDHDLAMTRLQHVFPEKANLDGARECMTTCELEHGALCSVRGPLRLKDLSVVDCKEMKVVSAPPECRFVALSYVWGDSINPDPAPDGSLPPWHLLPMTIQQCIQVTCDLGCEFLWIDRYCIRQDGSEEQRTQINQMGDIYAAAHLTIVAAAGQDPSYGLPGVLPTFRHLKFEKIGDAYIYALPRIDGLADVFYRSTWSKRAWTFQECFFSRRRLIFTDRQIIFVCNTSTRYEAKTKTAADDDYNDDSWLARCTPRRDTPIGLTDNVPMTQAGSYLSTYSSRILSFDDDAQNAISGALNTLVKDHVYHIWGVPFHFCMPNADAELSSRKYAAHGEIALSWSRVPSLYYNRRRKKFPSWSSLGWSGHIDSDIPVETAGISVQNAVSTTSLQDLVLASKIIPADCSQQLRLDLMTADLILVKSPETIDPWRVALPYETDIYVWFMTAWDVNPEELPNESTIKGVLLPLARQTLHPILPGCACVLLLQPHGPHYERVGSALLLLIPEGSSSSLDSFEYQGITCRYLTSPGIEQTDWWLRYFTKETIILK